MQQTECSLSSKDYRYPGEFLKAVRVTKGWSQRKAARKAGMSPSALCRLESGKNMLPRNLLELTDVYGVNPRDLKKCMPIPYKKTLSGIEIMKKSFPDNWQEILKDCMNALN